MGLGILDWLVLATYFGGLAVVAWSVRPRQRAQTTEDYFLAGRTIPTWAAAVSFLATAISAATFIGVPQISYGGNLTYLSTNIGAILAIIVVAVLFIPAFYRAGVTTVYGLLGQRFGPGAAEAAGWTFLVGRVFASGVRLYIASIPIAVLLAGSTTGIHEGLKLGAIVVLVIAGVGYAYLGGIRAVIWTDVVQAFLFVGAAVAAIAMLLWAIPAPMSEIHDALASPGGDPAKSKLTVFDLRVGEGFDPGNEFQLWAILFGISLINLGAYGTDQDLAQRLLTCKDAKRGARSAIGAALIAVPVTFLFLAIGLLLHIFYQRPDLMGAAAPAMLPDGSQRVFVHYILYEMPIGMKGLMLAGVLAAAVSSLSSEVNAMSSTFVADCYRRFARDRDDAHYVRVGRIGVIVAGCALGGFAWMCVWWDQGGTKLLIPFALKVMAFAYSGLVAVFLVALITRRGNTPSAIAALATGFLIIFVLQIGRGPDGGWNMNEHWLSQRLFGTNLAFPWQMLIATTIAFGVCCLGRRPIIPQAPSAAAVPA